MRVGMAVGRVRCRVTQVLRRGHRLPAVVVVDAEEGAGEGHHLAVGNEYAGVNLPRWAVTKAAPRRSMPKRLSRVAMTSWSVALDLFGCMAY